MAGQKDNEQSSASFNGDSDLEGKMIIDSTGVIIGKCKAINIGDDGQIGLTFETEINGTVVSPSKTIPYSAISKITDVIELRIPINIKIAQSIDEIKESTTDDKTAQDKDEEKEAKLVLDQEVEPEVILIDSTTDEDKGTNDEIVTSIEETVIPVNEELLIKPEKLVGKKTLTTPKDPTQADATEQLSKTLIEEKIVEIPDEKEIVVEDYSLAIIKELMVGLKESIKKLDRLFKIVSEGNDREKIEALKALTALTKISPELGLSLIPKMMSLSDEPQQEVRLIVAEQLADIGDSNPELFKEYFLEIFENVFDEPIEEIREFLIKALQNISLKLPEVALNGLGEFLDDVIIGKRVPEVPAKVLHDATLKVVSGNFQLTRIAIQVRLKFIAKGGKLADRCVEELEDYNATLIGLTIIESLSVSETKKLIKSATFKKLGTIFVDVIQHMLAAYEDGSFKLLQEVVDKKIEIPMTVIERFYEVKINKTLEGVKNVPMDVFLEGTIVTPEEAEQIIYRLVVQKRINAAITMNNDRTFITAYDSDEFNGKPKPTAVKTKPTTRKVTTTKKPTPKKTATTTKKATVAKKKSTSATTKKTTTAKKKKPTASTTKKTTTTAKKSTTSKAKK